METIFPPSQGRGEVSYLLLASPNPRSAWNVECFGQTSFVKFFSYVTPGTHLCLKSR